MPAAASGASGAVAPDGWHRAFFPDTGGLTIPRYDRGALPIGRTVPGPAVIEDEWSTTVVYPGQRCAADRLGNLLIDIAL